METSTESSKSARFEARITKTQKSLFQRAAALKGHRTLSEFVITSAQEEAERLIRDSEFVTLSQRDRRTFVGALFHSPKPNLKLKKAARRYNNLLHL